MYDEYTIITAEEAEDDYEVSDHIWYQYQDFEEEQEIRLYSGNIEIPGNFGPHEDADWNPFNVIIDGDLTIQGDFECWDRGNGHFYLITGDLYARNIFMEGCPNVVVLGNVDVEYGIIGSEGDDGGLFSVEGDVGAQALICLSFFNMEFSGGVRSAVISDSGRLNCQADCEDDGFDEYLIPEVLSDDESVDASAVKEHLMEGRNILNQDAFSNE